MSFLFSRKGKYTSIQDLIVLLKVKILVPNELEPTLCPALIIEQRGRTRQTASRERRVGRAAALLLFCAAGLPASSRLLEGARSRRLRPSRSS